jgi:hypothetical protein
MDVFVKAIETTGMIDEQRHLVIDEPLPIVGQVKVRIIILVPKTSQISEKEWYYPAANKPDYDFLNETKGEFTGNFPVTKSA